MLKLFCFTLALVLIGCSSPAPQQQNFQAAAPAQSPAAAPASAPAAAAPAAAAPAVSPPSPYGSKEAVTIASGARLRVRLGETLDTSRNRPGDRFAATLDQPVSVDGKVAIPRGARVSGHVTTASHSGRLRGRAVLGLTLDSVEVGGKTYPIATSSTTRVSAAHKKRNAALIGGGAGLGAAIGAIAGGGKGALIGAGAGAAAGTAGAAATGQKNVSLPAETPLTFSLRQPLSL